MKLDNIDDAKKVISFSLKLFVPSFIMILLALRMLNVSMGFNVESLPCYLITTALAFQVSMPILLMSNHNLKIRDLKKEKKQGK